jgi:hypothetical protein
VALVLPEQARNNGWPKSSCSRKSAAANPSRSVHKEEAAARSRPGRRLSREGNCARRAVLPPLAVGLSRCATVLTVPDTVSHTASASSARLRRMHILDRARPRLQSTAINVDDRGRFSRRAGRWRAARRSGGHPRRPQSSGCCARQSAAADPTACGRGGWPRSESKPALRRAGCVCRCRSDRRTADPRL